MIMMHELPFNTVDAQELQHGITEFQKMSRKTIRNDCIVIYEVEKKCICGGQIIKLLNTSSLKRVLSFVKVHVPRHGVDVGDGIDKKVFSISVDNASLMTRA
ncbi:hypothetical protein Lal_00003554 [Lupinus albus]|nr:hypothetical protein Lal_00003554 [Lupinus albus]